MKTLEELKKEMEDARADADAYDAVCGVVYSYDSYETAVRDIYINAYAYARAAAHAYADASVKAYDCAVTYISAHAATLVAADAYARANILDNNL